MELRQYWVYVGTKKVPSVLEKQIDHETFTKAKEYSIDKAKFGFLTSFYSQIQSTAVICFFIMPYFWNLSDDILVTTFGLTRSKSIRWEMYQSVTFTLITSLISTVVNLPFSIYSTFVIEQKHGFNKQTAGFYIKDKLKQFTLSLAISTPIIVAMVYIVRNGGPYFFLYLWMFCFVVICVIIFFHGEIMALFDKFTPLPPGKLRDRIEDLAREVGFPCANILVVEGSKRSSHSNAYQSGVFNRKRIVIYDTLIENYYASKDSEENKETKEANEPEKKSKGCNNDEIIAVLCHELGHWYCSHLIKHLTFMEVNYFIMFLIFSLCYNDPTFYAAFGFTNDQPVIIGLALMMMMLTPYNEIQSFMSTYMTRLFEYQADAFAKKKGYAEKLKSALVKLNIDNLGFPVYDELYSQFNHSHPTLIQRLKALDKTE